MNAERFAHVEEHPLGRHPALVLDDVTIYAHRGDNGAVVVWIDTEREPGDIVDPGKGYARVRVNVNDGGVFGYPPEVSQ